MEKITPFLWFDDKAEEAARFYISIFKNAKILSSSGNGGAGTSVTMEVEGQRLTLFNGGPMFKFTEAISLFVDCETQEEVDELWAKLTAGGAESRCGWLKDKYGLSWQIIPKALGQMLQDKDPKKAQRVLQAMLQMRKIDIAGLKKAYDQA
jgi:predicted 3-demethylubiquinone-9 3-methyltransferase (glyoxalase superfamily)